eukprot:364421-Chlamydomonas_euryale.AAC.4
MCGRLLQRPAIAAAGCCSGRLLQQQAVATAGYCSDRLLQQQAVAAADCCSSRLSNGRMLQQQAVAAARCCIGSLLQQQAVAAAGGCSCKLSLQAIWPSVDPFKSSKLMSSGVRPTQASKTRAKRCKCVHALATVWGRGASRVGSPDMQELWAVLHGRHGERCGEPWPCCTCSSLARWQDPL